MSGSRNRPVGHDGLGQVVEDQRMPGAQNDMIGEDADADEKVLSVLLMNSANHQQICLFYPICDTFWGKTRDSHGFPRGAAQCAALLSTSQLVKFPTGLARPPKHLLTIMQRTTLADLQTCIDDM